MDCAYCLLPTEIVLSVEGKPTCPECADLFDEIDGDWED